MKNVLCATAKTLGHNCSSYAMFKWDIVYVWSNNKEYNIFFIVI